MCVCVCVFFSQKILHLKEIDVPEHSTDPIVVLFFKEKSEHTKTFF